MIRKFKDLSISEAALLAEPVGTLYLKKDRYDGKCKKALEYFSRMFGDFPVEARRIMAIMSGEDPESYVPDNREMMLNTWSLSGDEDFTGFFGWRKIPESSGDASESTGDPTAPDTSSDTAPQDEKNN